MSYTRDLRFNSSHRTSGKERCGALSKIKITLFRWQIPIMGMGNRKFSLGIGRYMVRIPNVYSHMI